MPQATCNGDVTGGSTVRGKAWGFLFRGETIMEHQITTVQTASLFCSMDKLEAIGKLMIYVSPGKIYTSINPTTKLNLIYH